MRIEVPFSLTSVNRALYCARDRRARPGFGRVAGLLEDSWLNKCLEQSSHYPNTLLEYFTAAATTQSSRRQIAPNPSRAK